MAVTIYIVYAGVTIVENLLGTFLIQVLPANTYVPGFGFLATLVLIFVLGILVNNFITAGILHRLQEKLTEVPFIKVVYSPLRDLMNLFSKKGSNSLQKVVMVKFDHGKEALGLVTREHFGDVEALGLGPEKVAVYMPLSYGMGGYTMVVDRSQIRAVDISVEKAMSLALTGWIKTEPTQKN